MNKPSQRTIEFPLSSSKKANITITKKRMKNIRLTISRSGKISVSIPYFASYNYAYDFLVRRRDWINNELSKISQNQEKDSCLFTNNGKIFLMGNTFPLKVEQSTTNKVIFDSIYFIIKAKDISPEYVKNVFIKWCKQYFKILFETRLKMKYRQIFNDENYPSLKLKPMKSMWGNCNFVRRNITLNLYLAKAKSECIDYVITHELAHLIHPNHSKDFHALMQKLMPDYKARKKLLNAYSLRF